jgi:hypothetical protein
MSKSIPASEQVKRIHAVLIAPAVLAFSLCHTSPALAHAFGQRYDLPLPLWLYISGAGAVVALSFTVMALFFRRLNGSREALRLDLLGLPGLRWIGCRAIVIAVEISAVSTFVFILWASFADAQEVSENIAPTFIWVIWWVGLAFFSALIGNLWDLVNPLRILFAWAERLVGPFAVPESYPPRLGYWPAVALFFGFVWLELIAQGAETPLNLGLLITAYAVFTWTGMAVFGGAHWLKHGEVFSVVFGLLTRFAPLAGEERRLWLRLPAAGLLGRQPLPTSQICFVILLLTSVTFDGILETPLWKSILNWIAESQASRGTLLVLQQAGVDLLLFIKTLALVVLPGLFGAVFVATCWLVGRAGGQRVPQEIPLRELAGWFILSLVPIAIAYHMAHYLSYLLIAGQNIIPLASDPLGNGWDLFGTKSYRLDIGIVNAKMVWYVAVVAIVVGHVFAVYLAHATALRVFSSNRQALFSQLPMMALMVGYTMISLWVLSQPIVA